SRSRAHSPTSPAIGRAYSSPSATLRSAAAACLASAGVRTEWSSRTPESQTGYQIRSAMPEMPGTPSCSSSRSRSLPGSSSRRPNPPTASSATPGSAGSRPASQPSASADRRARSAANDVTPPKARPPAACSQRVRAALPRADPHDRLDRDAPDLPVTDPAGLGRLDHHPDEVLDVLVVAEHLDPDLGHQVDLVLRAAVDLGVAALPAVSGRFGHRHAVHPERLQCGLHVVELERLDHGRDELHVATSLRPLF